MNLSLSLTNSSLIMSYCYLMSLKTRNSSLKNLKNCYSRNCSDCLRNCYYCSMSSKKSCLNCYLNLSLRK